MTNIIFNDKFGFIPKKRIILDDVNLTIGKNVFPLEDIACIYYRPYNFSQNEWGSVYFSDHGEDYDPRGQLRTPNVFTFTKGQTDKVRNFLNYLDIDIVEKENDLGLMPGSSKVSKDTTEITNIISCPNCQSTDIQFMQNNKKGFSVGKAVGGAVLTGGVGTLAGFAGKKGKNQWHCTNCGNVFKKK